jgi:translation initiation factor IF-3
LLDYGKYIYEQAKREREARKAQKGVEIKEIRLRPKTNPYHASFKLKRAREFLAKGAKVRVRVMFRGREKDYPEIARELLANVVAQLEDIATVEQEPRMEGRTMHILLSPLKK